MLSLTRLMILFHIPIIFFSVHRQPLSFCMTLFQTGKYCQWNFLF
nr:MAG TPA: hypothetical protein [Bacteriophage sp.]